MLKVFVLIIAAGTAFAAPLAPSDEVSIGHKGSRIIGGEDAQDIYPYMVSLNYQGDGHACGASILTPNYVLTAAHCCMTGYPMEIYVGSIYLSNGGQKYPIRTYIVHGDYNPDEHWVNDICVIGLASPIQLSEKVQPVQLPPQDAAVNSGDSLTIIGWGAQADGSGPDRLKVLNNDKALSNAECNQKTGVNIAPGQLCTFAGVGFAVCSGDSGGPLTRNGVQVGLTSWGYIPCGSTGMPDVFTRVPYYINWISQVLASEAQQLKFASADQLA